jgi:hypothetical protein
VKGCSSGEVKRRALAEEWVSPKLYSNVACHGLSLASTLALTVEALSLEEEPLEP